MSTEHYLRIARGVFKLLNIAWYANIVAVVIVAVFFLVVLLSGGPRWSFYGSEVAIRGVETPLTETVSPPPSAEDLAARFEPRSAKLYVAARGAGDVAALLFDVLAAGLALAALYRMRELFRSVARAEVFTLENAAHIRAIALLLAAFALAAGAGTYVQGALALRYVDTAGTGLRPLLDWASMLDQLFGALITLLVSEAFRIGALLKRDADLTV